MEGWQSWSIALDLKSSVLKGTVGSNPTPSAIGYKKVAKSNRDEELGKLLYRLNLYYPKIVVCWKMICTCANLADKPSCLGGDEYEIG